MDFQTFFNVFILKFVLGLFDVVSDFFTAYTLVSGQLLCALYVASPTREVFEEFLGLENDIKLWGYLSICFTWLPALYRIAKLASYQEWSGISKRKIAERVTGYCLLFIAWPICLAAEGR